VRRIERLEMFDELEEWHLIQVSQFRCRSSNQENMHVLIRAAAQGHYCIVVAVNHASDAGRACSLASVLWSG
jgi:hypothetical protein